jgi:hypothetical protein
MFINAGVFHGREGGEYTSTSALNSYRTASMSPSL